MLFNSLSMGIIACKDMQPEPMSIQQSAGDLCEVNAVRASSIRWSFWKDQLKLLSRGPVKFFC